MYVCIGRFEQLPDHGRRDLVRCNRRYVPGTSLLMNIVTVMESFYLCNFRVKVLKTCAPPAPAPPSFFGLQILSSFLLLRRRRLPVALSLETTTAIDLTCFNGYNHRHKSSSGGNVRWVHQGQCQVWVWVWQFVV